MALMIPQQGWEGALNHTQTVHQMPPLRAYPHHLRADNDLALVLVRKVEKLDRVGEGLNSRKFP